MIEELRGAGRFLARSSSRRVGKKQGKQFDPFGLVCHGTPSIRPLTRKERNAPERDIA